MEYYFLERLAQLEMTKFVNGLNKKAKYKAVHHLCKFHCIDAGRDYEKCKLTSEHSEYKTNGCNVCAGVYD